MRSVLWFVLAGVFLVPANSSAQVHVHEQPDWVVDMGIAGVNIVASAATAGLTAAIRGEDISRAFLRGAAGGGVVFAGKRVAVGNFDGAGLLGREMASVGTSIVRNAGDGRGWLEEVWLPIGPVWLQVRSGEGRRLRLNLPDIVALAWATRASELELDWSRSLSNGAMVFTSSEHRMEHESRNLAGVAIGGLILLGPTIRDREIIQNHENVHVIQQDYLLHTVSRPLEAWGWRWITTRHIPIDLGLPPVTIYPGFLRDIGEAESEVLEHR